MAKLEIIKSKALTYWFGRCDYCEWKYFQLTHLMNYGRKTRIPLAFHLNQVRGHLFHTHGIQRGPKKPRTYEQMVISAHAKHQAVIAQRDKEGATQ